MFLFFRWKMEAHERRKRCVEPVIRPHRPVAVTFYAIHVTASCIASYRVEIF